MRLIGALSVTLAILVLGNWGEDRPIGASATTNELGSSFIATSKSQDDRIGPQPAQFEKSSPSDSMLSSKEFRQRLRSSARAPKKSGTQMVKGSKNHNKTTKKDSGKAPQVKGRSHKRESWESLKEDLLQNPRKFSLLNKASSIHMTQSDLSDDVIMFVQDLFESDGHFSQAEALGEMYHQEGNFGTAIQFLTDASANTNRPVSVNHLLGMSHLEWGDPQGAVAAFKKSLHAFDSIQQNLWDKRIYQEPVGGSRTPFCILVAIAQVKSDQPKKARHTLEVECADGVSISEYSQRIKPHIGLWLQKWPDQSIKTILD